MDIIGTNKKKVKARKEQPKKYYIPIPEAPLPCSNCGGDDETGHQRLCDLNFLEVTKEQAEKYYRKKLK